MLQGMDEGGKVTRRERTGHFEDVEGGRTLQTLTCARPSTPGSCHPRNAPEKNGQKMLLIKVGE
jgi:hypothetical protein